MRQADLALCTITRRARRVGYSKGRCACAAAVARENATRVIVSTDGVATLGAVDAES